MQDVEEEILAHLGVDGAIEGGVGGSDVSGELETGERCCVCFETESCAVGVSCAAFTVFILRLCDL